ncbi:MAG: MerR family transcriptional regulator [Catenulispora sp.]|nr:MerR family transcriptional regulator [Catenulispora sp.]
MRVAELAEASGVPASTLRFYEKAGLLAAERDANGYRRFGPDAVERLAFIAAAKRFGLPLEEIVAVVEVWAEQACRAVRDELRPRVAQRAAAARRQAAESAEFAERLEEALMRLERLPDRESRCDADCCDSTAGLSDTDNGTGTSTGTGAAPQERWRTAPIACELDAGGLNDRLAAWHRLLAAADPVRAPLPDGIRLTLPTRHTSALFELATAEQECCPFFDFRFHLDGPQTHLEVRAPAAGLQMLTALFA